MFLFMLLFKDGEEPPRLGSQHAHQQLFVQQQQQQHLRAIKKAQQQQQQNPNGMLSADVWHARQSKEQAMESYVTHHAHIFGFENESPSFALLDCGGRSSLVEIKLRRDD